MSITDTEREANLQAALSRAANHRPQPGDWRKMETALSAAWRADYPDAWRQNPRIATQITLRDTLAPGELRDRLETSQDDTGADS